MPFQHTIFSQRDLEETKHRVIRHIAEALNIADAFMITDAELHYQINGIDEDFYDLYEKYETALDHWYVAEERWERNKRPDAGMAERNAAASEYREAKRALILAIDDLISKRKKMK